MAFQRKKENFTCEHCKAKVVGNGYTNHCPACLWSKHVDTTPGDRASDCGGLMRPIRLEGGTDAYRLVHKCELCNYQKRNDTAPNDAPEQLVALAKSQAAQ